MAIRQALTGVDPLLHAGPLADSRPPSDTAPVNYLAHLVLAPQTPQGLIGSIAPDMIRGPLPADLPRAILDAAQEHQRIDRYTDTHHAFHRTRELLKQHVDPRLSGILADVLYDHVLASRWQDWRDDAFDRFVQDAEQALMRQRQQVPVGMQMIIGKMVEQGWLSSYNTAEGVLARLRQMSQRLSRRLDRKMDLALSPDALSEVFSAVADDFAVLWPRLKDYVDRCRTQTPDLMASSCSQERL